MIGTDEFFDACKSGKPDIVRQYIAEGGNLEAKDKDGNTGLMLAGYWGHSACLRELISAGADVNAADEDGSTVLMYAAYYGQGQADCVRELIAAGVNIEACDNWGWTALTKALNSYRYKAAQLLVEAGADIYAQDNEGRAAIDYCKSKRVKAKLIRIAQRHIRAAVKSADKPDIIQGFDTEL